MSTTPGRLAVSALVLAGLAMSSCDTGDGRTLQPPTVPAPTAIPVTVPGETDGVVLPSDPGEFDDSGDPEGLPTFVAFELFTPWRDGAPIDLRHGCDGPDVSPALAWSGVPDGTAELALTLVDQDAESIVHWLVTGIDPSFLSTPEGGAPAGSEPLANSFGVVGWTGPCPPAGATHTYRLTLHALDQQLEGVTSLSPSEALALIDEVTFESFSVTATATR